jgi:hypothetical protein
MAGQREARHEPRPDWPRKSRCASPQTKIRGPCGTKIELVVNFEVDRKHLPVVSLNRTG